jgi:phosphocarrier protein HPr
MVEKEVVIQNVKGLHARAASLFVKTNDVFQAKVTVCKGRVSVGGGSIMGLMMLGAGKGTVLTLRAEGKEEKEALDALSSLIEDKFHEEV